MVNVIDRIQQHAKQIANGEHETVKPGAAVAFTHACQNGDTIRQGDLYLTIVDAVPDGYVESKKPSVQLVPGNTQGSKHCLDSLQGVVMHLPKEWNEESLDGPYLTLSEDRTVLHPTHGSVLVLAGQMIHCTYQREWDKIQKAEQRARD